MRNKLHYEWKNIMQSFPSGNSLYSSIKIKLVQFICRLLEQDVVFDIFKYIFIFGNLVIDRMASKEEIIAHFPQYLHCFQERSLEHHEKKV